MAPTLDLRSYLRSLDAETLVELLHDQAGRDARLRHELEQRAAHGLLDGAQAAEGAATTTSAVLDTLQRLLDAGTPADLTPLALRTVDRIGASAGHAELDRAIALYARACAAHPPEPGPLADWILEVAFDRPDWPDPELAAFVPALGDTGLTRIRSTVDKVLTGDADDRRKAVAERLLEQLAEASGDVDTLLALLYRKPPRPEVSLKIVRVLRAAGRHTEAIAHAAKALGPGHGPLRALGDASAETDEALTSRRAEFRHDPTHVAYLALREAATAIGRWTAERGSAIRLLRERAEQGQRADELVRVLLAEGRAEEAWRAACQYDGSLSLRLELAEAREAEHPAEVIGVYRSHVEELISHRDVPAYRQAARQLRKLRTLHKRADKAEEFSAYLAELMETHKRKTRLLAEVRNARIALPKVIR